MHFSQDRENEMLENTQPEATRCKTLCTILVIMKALSCSQTLLVSSIGISATPLQHVNLGL